MNMTYETAAAKLGGRESRKIDNNTYLQRRAADTIAVRLHATDVLTFHADGRTVLNSGGWQTVTTKDRLNEYGPAGWRVSQARGVWTLDKLPYGDGSQEYGFADGITIHRDGTVTGSIDNATPTKLRAQVLKYVSAFVAAIRAGKVGSPSNGDCLFCNCLLRTDSGNTLGEASRDAEHIRSHMAERYFVPSLAWRAVELYGSRAERSMLAGRLGIIPQADAWPESDDRMWKDTAKHLRKHIYRQLGLAS